jgi:hypothetical protein
VGHTAGAAALVLLLTRLALRLRRGVVDPAAAPALRRAAAS